MKKYYRDEQLQFLQRTFINYGLMFVIKTLPTSFRTKNIFQKKRVRKDIIQRLNRKYTKESLKRFFTGEIGIRLNCLFNKRYSNTDVDNIAKFTLDCMKGLAFQDDKQIKELTIIKLKTKAKDNENIGVVIRKFK